MSTAPQITDVELPAPVLDWLSQPLAPTFTKAPIMNLVPPRIGQPWPGQGGIYAGLVRGDAGQPDQHVILAHATPPERLAWAAACEWARTVKADGHADFSAPSRNESALLHTNLRDQCEAGWHWTSTQYSQGYAFGQYFLIGYQYGNDKKYETRVRAVRRFAAQSLNPSEAA